MQFAHLDLRGASVAFHLPSRRSIACFAAQVASVLLFLGR
jgi:hypothetical protein